MAVLAEVLGQTPRGRIRVVFNVPLTAEHLAAGLAVPLDPDAEIIESVKGALTANDAASVTAIRAGEIIQREVTVPLAFGASLVEAKAAVEEAAVKTQNRVYAELADRYRYAGAWWDGSTWRTV